MDHPCGYMGSVLVYDVFGAIIYTELLFRSVCLVQLHLGAPSFVLRSFLL
jgi:hypothetical protein